MTATWVCEVCIEGLENTGGSLLFPVLSQLHRVRLQACGTVSVRSRGH